MLDYVETTHELNTLEMMEIETPRYPGATDMKAAYVECHVERPPSQRLVP